MKKKTIRNITNRTPIMLTGGLHNFTKQDLEMRVDTKLRMGKGPIIPYKLVVTHGLQVQFMQCNLSNEKETYYIDP